MDFGDAFKLLRAGTPIRREGWVNRVEIQTLPGHRESMSPYRYEMTEFLVEVEPEGLTSRWYPIDVDLLAADWEAV